MQCGVDCSAWSTAASATDSRRPAWRSSSVAGLRHHVIQNASYIHVAALVVPARHPFVMLPGRFPRAGLLARWMSAGGDAWPARARGGRSARCARARSPAPIRSSRQRGRDRSGSWWACPFCSSITSTSTCGAKGVMSPLPTPDSVVITQEQQLDPAARTMRVDHPGEAVGVPLLAHVIGVGEAPCQEGERAPAANSSSAVTR